jgi:hypothetical protein
MMLTRLYSRLFEKTFLCAEVVIFLRARTFGHSAPRSKTYSRRGPQLVDSLVCKKLASTRPNISILEQEAALGESRTSADPALPYWLKN